MKAKAQSLEAQAARSQELATSVAGLEALHADHMQELQEGRRSVALMDEAMAVRGRAAAAVRACLLFVPARARVRVR